MLQVSGSWSFMEDILGVNVDELSEVAAVASSDPREQHVLNEELADVLPGQRQRR